MQRKREGKCKSAVHMHRWLIALALAALTLTAAGCGDDDSKRNPTDLFGQDTQSVDMTSSGDTQMGDTSATDTMADTSVPPIDMSDTTPDMVDPGDMVDMVDPPLTCGVLPEPTSGRVCDVTPATGTATQLMIRGNLLSDTGIIEGGSLLIEQGQVNNEILCVGCDCTYDAATTTLVTCAEGVVSPGLINGHDHIRYNLNAPKPLDESIRYDHRHGWRRGSQSLNTGSPTNTREAVLHGEIRMLMGGATSIAGSISSVDASGLLRNVDNDTYSEGLGGEVKYSTFPLGDSDGSFHSNCADYNVQSTSNLNNRIYLPHIAEGLNDEAQNEFRCLSTSEGGANDLIAANTSVIHGIGLTPTDITEMAAAGSKLVWSIRTNVQLYGNTAPVPLYKNVGVTISLGTDWSASGSMNMLRELQCADHLNKNYFDLTFSERELWEMTTSNSAIAMGAEQELGSLSEGLIADIVIFDGLTNKDYRAVIDAEPSDVVLVMRGGEPLYGDADVIEGIVPTAEQGQCEEVDVCSVGKRLCAERDAGMTLASIQSSVGGGAYPLFFCGAPTDEPSCVPLRPNEYTGIGSATDQDGDGVVDGDDNCPSIFNPPRPIEGMLQGDYDNDSIGDLCDACPLNAGDDCVVYDPDDRDNDGIPNATDNCPDKANAPATAGDPQLDGDVDGIGDACDVCPDYTEANGYCLTTIYDVKQATIPEGTQITIEDAVITAVRDGQGAFIQMTGDNPGYIDEDYSGVYVYMPGVDPLPVRGDRVTVKGVTSNYYGQLQISNVFDVAISGSNNPLPSSVIIADASEIATGGSRADALEGVLVSVENVSVTEVNPTPDPSDADPNNEFVVTGGLRVNDYLFTYTLPNVSDTFTRLTGILHFGNSDSKLEPRDISDMGPPSLAQFSPDSIFLESALTADVNVTLTAPAETDTTVTLVYAGEVTGPTDVTVLTGQTQAAATLTGGNASTTLATVTASYDGLDQILNIRVFDSAEVRTIESLDPATQTVTTGGTGMLTITLDLPAEGNTDVALSVNGDLGLPLNDLVTVLDGERSADFIVTGGAAIGTQTVIATLGASMFSADVEVSDVPMPGLIFSEYVEGGSFNKAVELYNGTNADFDLSQCEILRYNNGGTTSTSYALTGTLASSATFVVAHTQASAPLQALADDLSDDPTNFNGNDALELVCGGAVIDSLGQVGNDPGTAWEANGVSTANQTLRRSCSLIAGDVDSSDAFDPSAEWETFAQDTFDGLGEHCP